MSKLKPVGWWTNLKNGEHYSEQEVVDCSEAALRLRLMMGLSEKVPTYPWDLDENNPNHAAIKAESLRLGRSMCSVMCTVEQLIGLRPKSQPTHKVKKWIKFQKWMSMRWETLNNK